MKMLTNVSVKDWMTSPVISIAPNTPINAAHQMMVDKGIRRLVVANDGKLLGIVTRGDIREAKPSDATTLSIWELNYLLAQLTVDKVMTRKVLTLHPEDSISKAAQLMLENKVSGLPVVDGDNHLIGMITESDIFRMLITSLEAER
jgi:acetoin utilization protein AcuB